MFSMLLKDAFPSDVWEAVMYKDVAAILTFISAFWEQFICLLQIN